MDRLPPSWKYRETVILDRTKPIPEEIKIVDQRVKNAKKRYELRNNLEEQYRDKDIEAQVMQERRLINRLHE